MTPTELVCRSRVESVVVYARGALVTRAVTLPETLPNDPLDLVVSGVTPLAEPGSVRAELAGGRDVTALRARLLIPDAPPTPGALIERLRTLDLERERIESERSRTIERRAELGAITLDPEVHSRARRKIEPTARFGDALATSTLVADLVAELDTRLRALDESLEQNARAREAAQLAAAQGRSAERMGSAHPVYEFVLRLARSDAPVQSLSVTYAIAAARWWPAYSARLTQGASRAQWTLGGLVAQASGEDWDDVRLALSTADLVHDARLPELPSLRLGRAQPAPRKGYRPPPPGLDAMFAAFDRAAASTPYVAGQLAQTKGGMIDTRTIATEVHAREAAMRQQAGADGYGDTLARLDDADLEEAEELAGVARDEGGYQPQEMAKKEAFGGVPAHAKRRAMAQVPAAEAPMPMAAPSAPAGFAAPARAAMPIQANRGRMAPSSGSTRAGGLGGGGGGETNAALLEDALDIPSQPASIEPADAWLDFDALAMGGGDDRTGHRGRLARKGDSTMAGRAAESVRAIESMAPPPRAQDPRATRGVFDHRYDAQGTTDVPSNGRAHRVVLAVADAEARPRLRTVPRESTDVFREAEVRNPFDAPLLAGPVDVFVEGALLTTAQIGATDKGGLIALGLGVEDRVRAARNARVDESNVGLLGGSTAIEHTVTIDVNSSLGRAVPIDIIDRVPVSDEKNVEVVSLGQSPPAEPYDQAERGHAVRGAMRWRMDLPAGGKTRVEFRYRITLPAKSEVVGGNRRD